MDEGAVQQVKNALYIRKGCKTCPVCDSEEIGGDAVTVEGGNADQAMTCYSCGAKWTDAYVCMGVFDLKTAEEPVGRLLTNIWLSDVDPQVSAGKAIINIIEENEEIVPLLMGLDPDLDAIIAERMKNNG